MSQPEIHTLICIKIRASKQLSLSKRLHRPVMAIGDRKRFSSNNIDLCRLNLNFFFYFLPPLLQPSGRAYKYLWPAIYLWRDHTVHSRALCAHGFFVLDDGIAVFGLSDARKFQKLKTTSTFVFILKSKFRAKKKQTPFCFILRSTLKLGFSL